MFFYYLFLMIFIFFLLSGLLIFCSQQKHLLMMLLSLEYMMLNVFMLLVFNLMEEISLSYLIMIFLIFSVSEGAIGLSVLVSMVRTHGNDYFKSYSVVW